MTLARIPADVKQLLYEHKLLLKQLYQQSQEAVLIKEQIINFASDKELSSEVILAPEVRNIYSETLVNMLVQYHALQRACETCAELYKEKKLEIEITTQKIKDAGDGIKWMFTSKTKKKAAIQAYHSLQDELHGDYAKLIRQLSHSVEQIKNTTADVNWQVFCNHPEDIIQIFDLLCPDVRKPYDSGYLVGHEGIAGPNLTIERMPENSTYSGDNTSCPTVSRAAEDVFKIPSANPKKDRSERPESNPDRPIFSPSISKPVQEKIVYDAPISENTYEVICVPVLNSAHAVCPFCDQIMATRAHVKYPSYKKMGR